MIIDRIENAPLYRGVGKRLAVALDVLKANQLPWLEAGRHELDGPRMYASVQEYASKPREQGKWEAHRQYIDVQYVAKGSELIGVADLRTLQVSEAYDPARDLEFFQGSGGYFVRLDAGMFAILYPHEAHMPCIAVAGAETVRKVVVKVLAE